MKHLINMTGMLLVELFRGTGSVGEVARKKGWKVISVDIDPSHRATHSVDVLKLKYKEMPVPDVVWASPPCTTYSLAANWVGHRVSGGRAVTAAAHEADRIVRRTLKMIRYWLQKNSRLTFCIENPRGHLRSLPEMNQIPYRVTTLYSQYGWPIHKPTDFWSNVPLRLRPATRPEHASGMVRVGSEPGWRKKLRVALGAPTERQDVMLGRIPPKLVGSILSQLS